MEEFSDNNIISLSSVKLHIDSLLKKYFLDEHFIKIYELDNKLIIKVNDEKEFSKDIECFYTELMLNLFMNKIPYTKSIFSKVEIDIA